MPRCLLLMLLVLTAAPAHAQSSVTPDQIAQWRHHAFEGRTVYRLVELDGREAIHARCESSASGLFLEAEIDLNETPILEWAWRVDAVFTDGADEQAREGDDFAARIYVVKDGGLMRWRTRAISYVWASDSARGSDWPNPYAAQAHMVAVRSGNAEAGRWHTERRDLRADFRRYHGLDPDRIDAIAIMTDCDDRKATAEAWYGDLRLLPAP